MKTPVMFLLMAISCCFGSSVAILDTKTNCLKKTVNTKVPELLLQLPNMFCTYIEGKDSHNEMSFKEVLQELSEALDSTGCSLEEVLQDVMEIVEDSIRKAADGVALTVLKLAGKTAGNWSKTLAGLMFHGVNQITGGLVG